MGTVEYIHITTSAGQPMRALPEVDAVKGVGLLGDRYATGSGHWRNVDNLRDVTLVAAETLEWLAAKFSIELRPGEARRNLTTRGVSLNDLLDKYFWVGDVLAHGSELCEPCSYLTEVLDKPVLRPLVHRGGLTARLVVGGRIRVGDRVQLAEKQVWEEDVARQPRESRSGRQKSAL